jgi:hypothetical protein
VGKCVAAQKRIHDMLVKDEEIDNMDKLLFTNDLITEVVGKLKKIEAGEYAQPVVEVKQEEQQVELIDLTDFNADEQAVSKVDEQLVGLSFEPSPHGKELTFGGGTLIDLLDSTPTTSPSMQHRTMVPLSAPLAASALTGNMVASSLTGNMAPMAPRSLTGNMAPMAPHSQTTNMTRPPQQQQQEPKGTQSTCSLILS